MLAEPKALAASLSQGLPFADAGEGGGGRSSSAVSAEGYREAAESSENSTRANDVYTGTLAVREVIKRELKGLSSPGLSRGGKGGMQIL